MRVVIAGGHGQIALILEQLLSDNADEVIGVVRNRDHIAEVEATGATAEVLDLEKADVTEVEGLIRGADAVVFAAGGGPDSGAARKDTVDRGAAVLLADAAEQAGVTRYVMISAMGADQADPDSDDGFAVYLRAKKAADDDVRRRDLAWTVVRPGRLTDGPGTGQVRIGTLDGGEIPRADVAATLLAVLHDPDTAARTFDLVSGDTTIADALTTL